MRCEECGRVIENNEMWQLGGDPHAPTSRSMRQMCWDCRTKGITDLRKKAEQTTEQAEKPLSETVIAEVNEAARAFEPGAA
jgi:hypothetical protein